MRVPAQPLKGISAAMTHIPRIEDEQSTQTDKDKLLSSISLCASFIWGLAHVVSLCKWHNLALDRYTSGKSAYIPFSATAGITDIVAVFRGFFLLLHCRWFCCLPSELSFVYVAAERNDEWEKCTIIGHLIIRHCCFVWSSDVSHHGTHDAQTFTMSFMNLFPLWMYITIPSRMGRSQILAEFFIRHRTDLTRMYAMFKNASGHGVRCTSNVSIIIVVSSVEAIPFPFVNFWFSSSQWFNGFIFMSSRTRIWT